MRIETPRRKEPKMQVEQMIRLDMRPPDSLHFGATLSHPGIAQECNFNPWIPCFCCCSAVDGAPGFYHVEVVQRIGNPAIAYASSTFERDIRHRTNPNRRSRSSYWSRGNHYVGKLEMSP